MFSANVLKENIKSEIQDSFKIFHFPKVPRDSKSSKCSSTVFYASIINMVQDFDLPILCSINLDRIGKTTVFAIMFFVIKRTTDKPHKLEGFERLFSLETI